MENRRLKIIKIIIIILILVSIGIIFTIVMLLKNNDSSTENEFKIDNSIDENIINPNGLTPDEEEIAYRNTIENSETEINNKSLKRVTDLNRFFTVKVCIEKYYNIVGELDINDRYGYSEEYKQDLRKDTYNRIYSNLDKEYIEMFNINGNNIIKLYSDYKNPEFYIDDMYEKRISSTLTIYIVYGRILKNIETDKIEQNGMIVKVDEENMTYSIYPYEYLQNKGYTNLDENSEFSTEQEEAIGKRGFNTYNPEDVNINEENIAKEYFSKYKIDLIYDKEKLYNSLDEEYRKAKFENYDEFLNYIKENDKNLTRSQINKYSVKKYKDYTQYVCIDTKGKVYIFNATAPFQYTLFLDKYTVDIPQFVEVYNESGYTAKCQENIEKFIGSINDKDYKYAYSVLTSKFKTENFETMESFKSYIQDNLFEQNNVECGEVNEIGDSMYECYVTIKNEENEKKVMKVNLKLYEKTEFKITFEIE